MKKYLLIFVLLCWLAAVLSLLWYPLIYLPTDFSRVTFYDKAAHLVFFGVMAYLVMAAVIAWDKFTFRQVAFFSFVFVALINVLGEFVQAYIPGRIPSYLDFLAGVVGASLAIPIAYMIHHSPRQKLLLHVCCAPCASAVAEILSSGFKLELYFFNPNIHPEREYRKRLAEVKKLARNFGIKLRIGNYDHQDWLAAIKGREDQPEGGSRCELCFAHRLREAAQLASRQNIPYYATTLTVSPHKNSYLVNKAGLAIAEITGQKFLDQDFKENNGWQRSLLLSRKFRFYRQKYCGCEFSAHSIKHVTHNT
ncbi:MAG: epoxyqueuosine reductase QueH [Patescibacteria group bacterium]|nr:epoxyqueuosine reductase QueH [Patescibacteria group bacterium]